MGGSCWSIGWLRWGVRERLDCSEMALQEWLEAVFGYERTALGRRSCCQSLKVLGHMDQRSARP